MARSSDDVRARQEVRKALLDVGERRQRNREEFAVIVEEVADLIARAEGVGLSMAEVARLVGIERTTLYRTYRDRNRYG